MTILIVTLYLLATIDSIASGYSAAAGRSALIRKRSHYLRAMGRGFLFGQAAAMISLTLVLAAIRFSPAPEALRADLVRVWARMLQVYLPFASLILLAFAVRLLPSVDVRCLTSTLVFGPLAGIRPLVGVAGLAWGLLAAPRPEIAAGGLSILALFLSLEAVLGQAFRPRETPESA